LATQVYNYASVGQIEDAALPALIIVGVGIIPIFVATRKLHKL
jgi:ABC-type Fe3+ transport system permease subunit